MSLRPHCPIPGITSKDRADGGWGSERIASLLLMFPLSHWPVPADVELDIENKNLSPGVRRMEAVVGHGHPFLDQGRQQLKLLANLEVTTKSVERTAETIGADIAAREQLRIDNYVNGTYIIQV